MKLTALVIAHEDSSYLSTKGEKIGQDSLTVLDQDKNKKLLDTVDLIFKGGTLENPASFVGKTIDVQILQIRPSKIGRVRMNAELVQKAA